MSGTFRTARPLAFALALAFLAGPALAADSEPPPARKVRLAATPATPVAIAKSIAEQAGIEVDVSALDASRTVTPDAGEVPFWTAVEKLAQKTDSRIVTTGGRLALKPGKPATPSPSCVSGPFRFAVREVQIRGDLQAGTSTYDVTLETCWEPRLSTYRIDSVPRVTDATDDTGKTFSVAPGGARTFTSGNIAPLAVRPVGLTRASKTLTLRGSITVTIADELLTFTFDGNKPAAGPQKGVTVSVAKFGADGDDWYADVELRYPRNGVTWESHEFYWARNNEMRLLPPGGTPIKADRADFGDGTIRYVFKNRAKQIGAGWKFDYRTPGPMREIVVPFELKDIPLP